MSVSQVRGQSDRCLKSPAADVTGVGRFSMRRCFLQPAHSLARPQLYISSSDGTFIHSTQNCITNHDPRASEIKTFFARSIPALKKKTLNESSI